MIYEKQLGKSRISYNPDTGEFLWIVAYKKPWLVGIIATTVMTNDYLYIKANGKHHSASRLAVELVSGFPVPDHLVVDHINRIRDDNCIANLRVVTQEENLANSERPTGVTGVKGISIYNRPSGNGHLYRVRLGGPTKYFRTLEEAVAYVGK